MAGFEPESSTLEGVEDIQSEPYLLLFTRWIAQLEAPQSLLLL